jgi:hypothetical protein
MSTLSVRPPDVPDGVDGGPEADDYSLAFAAWALTITVGLLTGLVAAVCVLTGL